MTSTVLPTASPPPPPSPAGDGVARGVLLSTGSQLVAKVVHLSVNVVSSLAIIHHLGPRGYGDYVLVVTVAGLSGLVGDFGLNKLAVREIARRPDAEPEVLGSLLTARLCLGVVAVILAQGVLVALGVSAEVRVAGLVLSTMALVEAALAVFVVFHVRLEQQYEALVRVAIEILETALVLVLVASGAGLVALVAAPVGAAVVGVALALGLVRRRAGSVPRPGTTVVGRLLRQSLVVGPALIIAAAYLRIPGVLLAWLSSAEEVGIYGAAYQPVEYLLLAAAVLVNVLLPLLARSYGDEPERFQVLYRRGTEALLGAVLPIAIATIALAPWLVEVAFGAEYADAAGPMRVLAGALVLMVVSFWQSYVLLAAGQQRLTLIYDAVALAATVALCVVVIPSEGGLGAAIAIAATSGLVVVWATIATATRADATLDYGRLARIALAAAGMVGVAALAANAGVPIGAAVGLGGVLYVAAVLASGLLDVSVLRRPPVVAP